MVRPGEAGLDPTPVEGKGARPALAIQAPKMLSGAQEICYIVNPCREYFLGPRNSFWAPESRAGRGATASASAGARGRPPASRGPTMRVVRGGEGGRGALGALCPRASLAPTTRTGFHNQLVQRWWCCQTLSISSAAPSLMALVSSYTGELNSKAEGLCHSERGGHNHAT